MCQCYASRLYSQSAWNMHMNNMSCSPTASRHQLGDHLLLFVLSLSKDLLQQQEQYIYVTTERATLTMRALLLLDTCTLPADTKWFCTIGSQISGSTSAGRPLMNACDKSWKKSQSDTLSVGVMVCHMYCYEKVELPVRRSPSSRCRGMAWHGTT
jgi:hypothetical protein